MTDVPHPFTLGVVCMTTDALSSRSLTMRHLLLAALIALAILPAAARGDDPDPAILSCSPAPGPGRYLQAVILFKRLRILRVMYGDGSIRDWPNIDYSHQPIVTSDQDGASVTLRTGLTSLVYRDATTHEISDEVCRMSQPGPGEREWLDPAKHWP